MKIKNLNNLINEKDSDIKNILISWAQKNTKIFKIKENVIVLNDNNYAENFGIQWNEFQLTQFDSFTKLPLTEERLISCTEWDVKELRGKLILEIGGGAGRFTEIFLKYGAKIITIDMSDAIFSNLKNNQNKNAVFIQGDFKSLAGLENCFDYVFCYGVAQHTPNPKEVYEYCFNFAKSNGLISIDQYIKLWLPNAFYHPKYFWRPITKRMKPKTLLKIIRKYIPIYFVFDQFLIKLCYFRKLANLIRGCIPIPCWNYTGYKNINQSRSNLVEWAIMDTFDALGSKYDYPITKKKLNKYTRGLKLKKRILKKGGNGLIFNGTKS